MALDIIVAAVGASLSFFLWRIERVLTKPEPPAPAPKLPPPPETQTAKQRWELNRPHMGVGTFAPTKGFR